MNLCESKYKAQEEKDAEAFDSSIALGTFILVLDSTVKSTWSSGVSSTQWLLSRHAATWLSNRCIKLGASPSTPNPERIWVSLIFVGSANRSVVAKFIFFGCTMFVHISRECWAPCSLTQSTQHTTTHSTSTFDSELKNYFESQQFTPTTKTPRPTDTNECGNSDKNPLWRPPCDDDKMHQIMPPPKPPTP